MLNADMDTGLEEAMESLSLGNSGSSYPVWVSSLVALRQFVSTICL